MTVNTVDLVSTDTTPPPPKGLPATTHSFYYVMLILALAFVALIIAILVTLRDQAFQSPPSSSRSHYVVRASNPDLPQIQDRRIETPTAVAPAAKSGEAQVTNPMAGGNTASVGTGGSAGASSASSVPTKSGTAAVPTLGNTPNFKLSLFLKVNHDKQQQRMSVSLPVTVLAAASPTSPELATTITASVAASRKAENETSTRKQRIGQVRTAVLTSRESGGLAQKSQDEPVEAQSKKQEPKDLKEPLLTEENATAKFLMFPLRTEHDENLYKFYEKAVMVYWVPEEIPFQKDCEQYKKLTVGQKLVLDNMLAFFASADGIIVENLAARFLTEVKHPLARAFYSQQIAVEQIHADTYSRFIYALVPERKEQEHLFRAIETLPSVRGKAMWAVKWLESDRSFAERLVAFACVEGVFFSGAFSVIFYFKIKLNLMSEGLGVANEMIARDEGLHCDFACYLYREMLVNKLSQAQVEEIIDGCVETEREFIAKSIPVAMIGMNAHNMEEYIEFCADRLLGELGYNKKYNVKNPFPWMVNSALNAKSNFFEKRVSEYSKATYAWNLSARPSNTDDGAKKIKAKKPKKTLETAAGILHTPVAAPSATATPSASAAAAAAASFAASVNVHSQPKAKALPIAPSVTKSYVDSLDF